MTSFTLTTIFLTISAALIHPIQGMDGEVKGHIKTAGMIQDETTERSACPPLDVDLIDERELHLRSLDIKTRDKEARRENIDTLKNFDGCKEIQFTVRFSLFPRTRTRPDASFFNPSHTMVSLEVAIRGTLCRREKLDARK